MKKKLTVIVAVLLIVCLAVCFTACGEEQSKRLVFGKEIVKLTSQLDILSNLKNGSADIGVMDSVMAGYYMTTGTYAADLQAISGLVLAEEEYGIAAKKGNAALIGKINEAMIYLATQVGEGSLNATATTFGLASEILVTSATTNPNASATDNSWNAVKTAKKLIVGYTEFAPIAFKNDASTLTGFDIELARKVVAYLNTAYSAEIVIEFQVIDWDTKETLLTNGSIDLVWNGMTITDERVANMEISIPYMANKQVAVIRKADATKYAYSNSISDFVIGAKDAIIAVESGSAAQDCMEY